MQDDLPVSLNEFESLLISPLFHSSRNNGPLYFSIAIPSNSSIEVFVESKEVFTFVNMTSDLCRHGVIRNSKDLSQSGKFRLFVFSKSFLTTDDVIRATVSSHLPALFQDIRTDPAKPTLVPVFPTVPIGFRDLCTSELFKHETQCDWKFVVGGGATNDRFKLLDMHECIINGVSNQDQNFVYFLALAPGNSPSAEGYLISPVIERTSSHFLLSFWYMPHCNETTVRAYVVPSYQAIQQGISEQKRLVFNKSHNESVNKWLFMFTPIEIPATFKTFQVSSTKKASSELSLLQLLPPFEQYFLNAFGLVNQI